MEKTHVTHGFPALFDAECDTLILGSFPSPKSREQAFYYGHPQNRFWKVMAQVLDEAVPQSIAEKKHMLLKHHIALWDSLEECDISGASDSSITAPVPTDIPRLLAQTKITRIFTTGAAAQTFYEKLNYPRTNIHATRLPSTSPANCAISLEKLVEAYTVIRK